MSDYAIMRDAMLSEQDGMRAEMRELRAEIERLQTHITEIKEQLLLARRSNSTKQLEIERGMSEWQPIETAPYGEELLVWFPSRFSGGYFGLCQKEEDDNWINDGGETITPTFKPTHWMPLPEQPTPERKTG